MVVTDGEVGRYVTTGVLKAGAVCRVACDLGCVGPDYLAHVAPCLETAWRGTLIVVRGGSISVDLAVVEHIGNDPINTSIIHTRSDVLTIPATVHIAEGTLAES